MIVVSESTVKDDSLAWFDATRHTVLHRREIAASEQVHQLHNKVLSGSVTVMSGC